MYCIFNQYRVITIPKKDPQKLEKAHYLINDDFDHKNAQNKKDVEFNFSSDKLD